MKTTFGLPFPTIELSESLTFFHVFQPIITLQDDTIYGFESLIRGKKIQNPQSLFAKAEKQKKRLDLDLSSVIRSIASFHQCLLAKEQDLHLTVNVFPSTVLEPSFHWFIEDLMKTVNIAPSRIIFELNEAETVQNLIRLQERVRYLKEAGFKIALDDLGKGQSSLRVALELEPDMIKLDQYFCIDLERSIKKQHFLNWITSYFSEAGTCVTLEGIETESQLIIAKQTGVHYGQGYHLGRPQPFICPSNS
ncbi:putative signaling protein [Neobacillus rhizosphaerae]|uniref:Signaling protein n=1 Tax=Neobacillus rhizosphaerae TaxID=2880965 RepID=A0ABM9EQS2_9BACI|nr:EAL domain-containing protein [Neobacillus rhizosphaerae]CAH2714967.1 putative signaling protein [Neobacillus rhizosphaerae]